MKPIIQQFSKTLLKLAMMAVFLISFSCSQETDMNSLENLEVVNASAKKGKKVKRSWKIRGSGTFEPDFSLAAECGRLLPLKIEGSGNASHIGRFDVAITWCTGGIGPGFPNFITGTITAANGDEIYFESVLFGESFTDYRVTGGSGRFFEAEGEFRLNQTDFELESGPGEPPSGTYANEGGGYIKY